MNPESKPTWPLVLLAASGLHGFAKLLCVAVWFFAANWNVSVSPTCALMLLGVNVSVPLPPTTIMWFCEATDVGAAEPGYEPYVVVCVWPSTVTVAVTVTTLAGAVAVATEVSDAAAVVDEALAVLFPTALDWKVANLSPGLTAKTMPCWQWPVCRQ